MEECKRMGLKVLGPDINESLKGFAVNKAGEIRFGLGGLKGVGEAALENIIIEREKNGHFTTPWDLVKRISQRVVNKKTFESLAYAGAFDCFKEYHRRHYVYAKEGDISLTEKVIKYASKLQQEALSAQASLFGESTGTAMPLPKVDNIEPFTEIEKLHFEKEESS